MIVARKGRLLARTGHDHGTARGNARGL